MNSTDELILIRQPSTESPEPHYQGLYQIIDVNGPVYTLRHHQRGEMKVHHNRTKPFTSIGVDSFDTSSSEDEGNFLEKEVSDAISDRRLERRITILNDNLDYVGNICQAFIRGEKC
ncbi:hypothetical protein RF11_03647 [Thelohanellus kitauei]|uniref:Uncharacterized protein n=1 Tax=Thelohanellus kitauei TaxID=669202 RepID=A0A0C2MYI6_THEKT|nr:hypothetical protein RF11_03647 [Thelohanellus kitauei]